MALSDKKIIQEIEEGNIIIEPFDKRNLATSSYDVTLGEFYFRPHHSLKDNVYNIYNEDQTKEFWGGVQKADFAASVMRETKGIDGTDKVILIKPGETILCHTNEFIGGQNHITTMMKARSSMGRQLLAVCKCAGWGDVGYINRWTMEITNYSTKYTIPLVVGRRIAQIIFMDTGEILDKDYSVAGKYQTSDDLEMLKKNWTPEDMIPKLWKDRDIKK